jgi:hypothetical protein
MSDVSASERLRQVLVFLAKQTLERSSKSNQGTISSDSPLIAFRRAFKGLFGKEHKGLSEPFASGDAKSSLVANNKRYGSHPP